MVFPAKVFNFCYPLRVLEKNWRSCKYQFNVVFFADGNNIKKCIDNVPVIDQTATVNVCLEQGSI